MAHDAGFFFGLAAVFAGGVQIGIQLGIQLAHSQRNRPQPTTNDETRG